MFGRGDERDWLRRGRPFRIALTLALLSAGLLGRAAWIAFENLSARHRSAVLPDLPTMNEILPGFEVNSWYGMMAPAGTPKAIVNLLQRETAKALKAPDVQERLRQLGLDPGGSTPEEHAAQLRTDLGRWAKVAKAAKLKID